MIYDPDYARAYSIIRCIAWNCGYSACLHGSFTRDMDIVLVPWTDQASDIEPVLNMIEASTDTRIQTKEGTAKPHGRKAWTFLFKKFGDPRWIDISVMPRVSISQ